MSGRPTLFKAVGGVLLALFIAACQGSTGENGKPTVTSLALSGVSNTGAVFNATVLPIEGDATVWFEWSDNENFSDHQDTEHVGIAKSPGEIPFSTSIEGLTPGVTYYYRPAAAYSGGSARYGSSDYFTPTQEDASRLVVNCPGDPEEPVPGKMTLREAWEALDPDGVIVFDRRLSGETITLERVAEEHSTLKGEVFAMVMVPSPHWEFQGYQERDYGRSALYAQKSLTLDGGELSSPVTVSWGGGAESEARVIAVYGNLTMSKVKVRNGVARASAIAGTQPYTLARGGGVAVWGVATLTDCEISGNSVYGDATASRDRGAFGGSIYADTVLLENCVVGGNLAVGYGASGGGVFSVGGVETWAESYIRKSSITGNGVKGQHAYGGGVYSDGGGPGNLMSIYIENTTIAGNYVGDNPDIDQSAMSQYYARGGGVYMSNGYLYLTSCTIAENRVEGYYYEFSGKPNVGGGGIAATIGNAHVVEAIVLRHSAIVGNTVRKVASDGTTLSDGAGDVFSGSLLNFYSDGYNLVGDINFDYMLAPIPWWMCLSRIHWPKVGDEANVTLADALDVAEKTVSNSIVSAGANPGAPVTLSYPPGPAAIDIIPTGSYGVTNVYAGYDLYDGGVPDVFLNLLLEKLRTDYPELLGADFGESVGDFTGVTFYGPASTWPAEPANAPWIAFWKTLRTEIDGRFGPQGLNDDFWATWETGYLDGNTYMEVDMWDSWIDSVVAEDIRGTARPQGPSSDIGAVEAE